MSRVVCEEREIHSGRFRADLKVYIDATDRLEHATQEA